MGCRNIYPNVLESDVECALRLENQAHRLVPGVSRYNTVTRNGVCAFKTVNVYSALLCTANMTRCLSMYPIRMFDSEMRNPRAAEWLSDAFGMHKIVWKNRVRY